MHLVPGCPARVLLPLLVLFYNMFEQINNQSINQSINGFMFSLCQQIWGEVAAFALASPALSVCGAKGLLISDHICQSYLKVTLFHLGHGLCLSLDGTKVSDGGGVLRSSPSAAN